MKIKVITSRTTNEVEHEKRVNTFLESQDQDTLVSIEHLVNAGSGFSKYTARPEITTIISYKGN